MLTFPKSAHERAVNGDEYLLASCGTPMCLADVKVVDEDMVECPPGVVGEIVIRGEQVLKGYFRNEEGTAKAFHDGWFRTGDMARRDEEGFFYIVDRMKDMIITGGENVYSREVEEVLYTHPSVSEAAVVGLPDPKWGENVTADHRAAPRHDGHRGRDHRHRPRPPGRVQEAEAGDLPRRAPEDGQRQDHQARTARPLHRVSALPSRPLGASGIAVSVMSLGSWRTFERMARDEGVAVMQAAMEAGIDFLDDARYDDETGSAPIPTGYSEVVFGELLRAAGWRRDDVTIANKLWWEHWPTQDAAAELDGSLGRMGLDHVDLIYAIAPPRSLPVAEVVGQVGGLIASGRARAWGTGMWSATQLAEAIDVCDATGVPRPSAAQMACSLAEHSQSSDPAMRTQLRRGPVGLVAAYVLAGGTLSGKYVDGEHGRASGDDSPTARRGKGRAVAWSSSARRGGWRRPTWRSPSRWPTPNFPASCSAPPVPRRSP